MDDYFLSMSRYDILKGRQPPRIIPTHFLKGENLTLVLLKSVDATKETAKKLLNEVRKPYAVFVSDTIDMKFLINEFEDTERDFSFSLFSHSMNNINSSAIERKWSGQERSVLQDLNFNHLKFDRIQGFHVWSDSIEGAVWNGHEVFLSTHRKLNFIDKGMTFYQRIQRVKALGAEFYSKNALLVDQTGPQGLSVKFPGSINYYEFEEGKLAFTRE